MIFIIFFALVFIATFILWKYIHLKHDVYEYIEKLDIAINKMLKNEELKTQALNEEINKENKIVTLLETNIKEKVETLVKKLNL